MLFGCLQRKPDLPPPPEPRSDRRTESPAGRPGILFASPAGASGGWVDLRYLKELQAKGFEPDYTDELEDLRWERLVRYNALILSITPNARDVLLRQATSSPTKIEAFVSLVEKF